MNMSDAAVAIRSLPRRYSEVVSGPAGDPAWERLLRSVGGEGRSALGFVVHVTGLLTALGTAIAALPLQSRPTVSVASLDAKFSEPGPGLATSQTIEALRVAADRAGAAVAGRSHEEFDRNCNVDGHDIEARQFVEQVVHSCVAYLKDAQATIDAARY
jgi:hypothetical protein